MTDPVNLNEQPAIVGVPTTDPTPNSYIEPEDAEARLTSRYGLELTTTRLAYGHVLAASMALDEEGPFQGVKYVVDQEREWPRTFKYGWPNMIATPSPVMVSSQRPGAWYLNYEGVVPSQLVDWVCLEAWRLTHLPFDRVPTQEGVGGGVTVHWAPPPGHKGGIDGQLDRLQRQLISPFLLVEGHLSPFMVYDAL